MWVHFQYLSDITNHCKIIKKKIKSEFVKKVNKNKTKKSHSLLASAMLTVGWRLVGSSFSANFTLPVKQSKKKSMNNSEECERAMVDEGRCEEDQ